MEISLGFVISGGSEVVLYDVNRHALRIMGKIVSNYILSENVDLEVSYTTDLKDALENSDFVITTIRVGGYKNIIEILMKYGVHGISIGKISDLILSILRLHLDKYRLLAQGIVERDKDLIIQAIALDPFTPSPKEAERIFDIFIKSSEKFLPIKFN